MSPLIEARKPELKALCKQHRVRRLELFGSASRQDFDSEHSDVDFLVVFEPAAPEQHAKRYFDLLAALQDLFERRIDLVEIDAVSNPYLRSGIDQSRTTVYAA